MKFFRWIANSFSTRLKQEDRLSEAAISIKQKPEDTDVIGAHKVFIRGRWHQVMAVSIDQEEILINNGGMRFINSPDEQSSIEIGNWFPVNIIEKIWIAKDALAVYQAHVMQSYEIDFGRWRWVCSCDDHGQWHWQEEPRPDHVGIEDNAFNQHINKKEYEARP